MRIKIGRFALMMACLFSIFGCSRKNNLLFGRIEAEMDGHDIVVTDCYRLSVNPPEKISSNEYHFQPCKDAVIIIRDNNLTVNGQSFGPLAPGAEIVVDHGAVSLQNRPAANANNKPNS